MSPSWISPALTGPDVSLFFYYTPLTQTLTAFAETAYDLDADLPIYMVPDLYNSIHFEKSRRI